MGGYLMNTTFQEQQQENNALSTFDNMIAAYIIIGKEFENE
jgi:hypothetical protein